MLSNQVTHQRRAGPFFNPLSAGIPKCQQRIEEHHSLIIILRVLIIFIVNFFCSNKSPPKAPPREGIQVKNYAINPRVRPFDIWVRGRGSMAPVGKESVATHDAEFGGHVEVIKPGPRRHLWRSAGGIVLGAYFFLSILIWMNAQVWLWEKWCEK